MKIYVAFAEFWVYAWDYQTKSNTGYRHYKARTVHARNEKSAIAKMQRHIRKIMRPTSRKKPSKFEKAHPSAMEIRYVFVMRKEQFLGEIGDDRALA